MNLTPVFLVVKAYIVAVKNSMLILKSNAALIMDQVRTATLRYSLRRWISYYYYCNDMRLSVSVELRQLTGPVSNFHYARVSNKQRYNDNDRGKPKN